MQIQNEADAYRRFKAWRWRDNEGVPKCPYCTAAAVYEYQARQIFKCGFCGQQFSAATGTPFARRKCSYAALMVAIEERPHAAELARRTGLTYKSAWRLAQIAAELPR